MEKNNTSDNGQGGVALHKVLKLRRRHLLNKNDRLRLRYVVMSGAVLMTAFAAVQALPSLFSDHQNMGAVGFYDGEDNSAERLADESVVAARGGAHVVDEAVSAKVSDGIRRAAVAMRKPERPRVREVKIGAGDTLAGVLQELGKLDGRESFLAVKAMEKHFDPRKVKPGQKIALAFSPRDEGGVTTLQEIHFKISPVKEVHIRPDGAGDFVAEMVEKEVITHTHAKIAEIETSLYGSAARAGIPAQVIANVIRTYSWSVDFQRDIRRGDKIEVLYETRESEDGEFAGYGDISYASLSVGGKEKPIYRYEMKDGRVDYFGKDGRSIRKTLMSTPIDGARLSSGFGMRRHPILGYNKMHKGVDFAAPTGTPIYAAGDGVIDYAGRKGAYGNYIRIRHNSTLKTAYAHMHRLAKGMVSGKRVEQGQIIGYVGTTGRSTGPHLHYEVLSGGVQVNPRNIDLPVGERLAGEELKRFKALSGAIYQQYASLAEAEVKVAQVSEN